VRADSLPKLTEAGRRTLVDYGVSLVVDLRGTHEYEQDPPEALPVRVQREPMSSHGVPAAHEWTSMHEAYLAFVDRYRAELARCLTALGDAEPPAAVHCSGGRDRTGIVCGMALWLAGVDPETIAADHALSDESWAPSHDEWLASAPDEAERERRRRISEPAGRTLADVLEEVEAREGIRTLLLEAGAEAAALDRLARRLRGNP
jgi:rhodanese-related sulfurtransferase